jgi:hypothetical protein
MAGINRHWKVGVLLGGAWCMAGWLCAAEGPDKVSYEGQVYPVLEEFCLGCHGERERGGLDLRPYAQVEGLSGAEDTFEAVLRVLENGEMPPSNKPQPTMGQRELVVDWIRANLFPVDCEHPDPGRVTLRRLNREEYNNTVRDLLGVEVRPADDFPADDAGYGFDNIGDVLSMPPVLFERYMEAADKVLEAALVPENPLYRRFFGERLPEDPGVEEARGLLRKFATRAYRRPVKREELDRLVGLYELARGAGEDFEGGVRLGMQGVLVSPHFLFRGEFQRDPDNPEFVRPLDEYALASRLSYFLWSSMPDERLVDLADNGQLRANLEREVDRMLRDPKAKALVANFGGQWLQLRNLDIVRPDARRFPSFDEELRGAMLRETEMFFERIVSEDGSVLDFLEADYTYVNGRLAKHYGMEGVEGDAFRRVELAGTGRAGVLTHGSVLTLTSNPTRTSPVKRGKWVLDNLLGTPPPPPPPNVPELEAQGELKGSLRERMEQHRQNPNCISCHERMDPIGFGLEHFDGVGAWRDQDGEGEIDASGVLVSGQEFEGAEGLVKVLSSQQQELFVRCLTEKMLTYALGRGLEHYDACAVDKITARVMGQEYRFSSLVGGIVRSVPFQLRRGDAAALSAAVGGRQ